MGPRFSTFDWTQTSARLRELLADHRFELDASGRRLRSRSGIEFVPPAILRVPGAIAPQTVDDVYAGLDSRPGLHSVVLMRAGATALGLWRDDQLLAHKAFKRYVVRGRGRAQPTHLARRGKSRFGSRLRLQNAHRQLEETGERLYDWRHEFGPVRVAFVAAPTRLWADMVRTAPGVPFGDEHIIAVPFHVHTPTFEEVTRVRRKLGRGRIDFRSGDANQR